MVFFSTQDSYYGKETLLKRHLEMAAWVRGKPRDLRILRPPHFPIYISVRILGGEGAVC